MSKSRTESPETRKRQILDAAKGLLAQKGYQDIKMDDVAKKANLAKGTLYLHFKDKEQIVAAVFEDLMMQLEAKFNLLTKQKGLKLLRSIAETNLQFLRENHDFFSQFIHTRWTLTGSNQALVKKRFQKHMEMMKRFIHSAVKTGEIPTYDPFIGSFYFMSLIRMFWVKDQIFNISKNSSNEIDILMDLFLHGIHGTKKGKRQ
jgi:TetR/AcrR family transcriptional regulator